MDIYEKASKLLCYTDTEMFRTAVDLSCITLAELEADPAGCDSRIAGAMEELHNSEF